MKLTIVGCTGSFPGPGSPASCYLLTANDGERTWKIVMDLGSGALGAIQRYTDLEDIDAIFLTHLHPDHCMDLCGLHVAVRWKPGGWGRGRIPVWGPAATADRIRPGQSRAVGGWVVIRPSSRVRFVRGGDFHRRCTTRQTTNRTALETPLSDAKHKGVPRRAALNLMQESAAPKCCIPPTIRAP